MQNQHKDGQTFTRPNGERYILKNGQYYQMQSPKVDPHDDAEISKLSLEAHNKRVLVDASHEFMRMNRQTTTGPARGIPFVSDALQNTPGSPLYDGNVQAMQGINGRFAPQLRPIGSGRLMQIELDAFKSALPRITNSGEVNQKLTQQYEREAHKATAEAEFKRNWLHSTGSLQGANEAFDRLYKEASPPVAPLEHSPTHQAQVPAVTPTQSRQPHQLTDDEIRAQLGLK